MGSPPPTDALGNAVAAPRWQGAQVYHRPLWLLGRALAAAALILPFLLVRFARPESLLAYLLVAAACLLQVRAGLLLALALLLHLEDG